LIFEKENSHRSVTVTSDQVEFLRPHCCFSAVPDPEFPAQIMDMSLGCPRADEEFRGDLAIG
jgi:hypothetical protein